MNSSVLMPDVCLPTSLIHESPLCPALWPFGLDLLPDESYLVGGIVRDVLLGRQADYLDLDFVMPERAIETARAIAQRYGAGFVILDAERHIARVVFERATVDFALQEGNTLEEDLKRRDFTVNAMAYNPHTEILVDPLGGYQDLQRRCLRMVSAQNLRDDPLRLLRAYRQSAQLGFELEHATAAAIAAQSQHLNQIAAERVQSELNTLLSTAEATPWLRRAWAAGLFSFWLPEVSDLSLTHIERLNRLEQLIEQLWPKLLISDPAHLKSALGKFGYIALARLIALTPAQAERAEHQLQQLKYSKLEVRAAGTVRRLQIQLQGVPLSIRDRFFLFQNIGSLFPVLVLTWLIAQPEDWTIASLRESAIAPLVHHYLDPSDPVAYPKPLLGGKALMQALNLRPGPKLGELLRELQIAQAEGKVKNSAEAIDWATGYLRGEL